MSPRLDSPLPSSASGTLRCPMEPPSTVARTTKAIHPRMAVLRCRALQRPARAAIDEDMSGPPWSGGDWCGCEDMPRASSHRPRTASGGPPKVNPTLTGPGTPRLSPARRTDTVGRDLATATRPQLLEREHDLEGLDDLLAEARAGRGAVALVEAPAGLGKTALLRALRSLAVDAGMRVLTATGVELQRDFAFGVVRQLFEPVVDEELFAGQ